MTWCAALGPAPRPRAFGASFDAFSVLGRMRGAPMMRFDAPGFILRSASSVIAQHASSYYVPS